MKTCLRHRELFEDAIVPATPDPRDEDEKDRYMRRQLWWALIGLALFALVMLFGWGGVQAAGGGASNGAPLFPPTADLASAAWVNGWRGPCPLCFSGRISPASRRAPVYDGNAPQQRIGREPGHSGGAAPAPWSIASCARLPLADVPAL